MQTIINKCEHHKYQGVFSPFCHLIKIFKHFYCNFNGQLTATL